MTSRRIYDLAVAGDDPYPDDVCPSCRADITGWRDELAHRSGGGWTLDSSPHCEWTRDELSARAIARRLIAEGVTNWPGRQRNTKGQFV